MQCYYAAPLAFTESLRTTAVSEGCVFLYQLFLAGVLAAFAAFSGLNRRSFLILSESLLSLWPFPYSIYLDTSTIASLLLKPCSAYIQPFWPAKAVKASIATRWNSGCVGCFWQCSLLLGKACSLGVVLRLKAYFGLYCIKHVQYSEHT